MIKKLLRNLWYTTILKVAYLLCMVLFGLRSYGKENIPKKGGFLLLSNHQSFLDPVICSTPLNRICCFAARDNLFKSLLGTFIASVNAIPIKRQTADIKAIRLFIEKLKAGYGLVLFPEASRCEDGKIRDIKPGFSLLAKRSNCPVIPVVIDGAYECWPRSRKFFRLGKIVIHYGKPIPAEELKIMGDEKFIELLTMNLRQMQSQLRQKQGKKPFDYS